MCMKHKLTKHLWVYFVSRASEGACALKIHSSRICYFPVPVFDQSCDKMRKCVVLQMEFGDLILRVMCMCSAVLAQVASQQQQQQQHHDHQNLLKDKGHIQDQQ